MTLSPGTRLGPHEVAAQIDAGGMGHVYKATDTRLGRTVAVKVSRDEFSARFERELVKEPVYDVKVLDRMVTRVVREIRLLDQALESTNARTTVAAYDQDDTVLGELA